MDFWNGVRGLSNDIFGIGFFVFRRRGFFV